MSALSPSSRSSAPANHLKCVLNTRCNKFVLRDHLRISNREMKQCHLTQDFDCSAKSWEIGITAYDGSCCCCCCCRRGAPCRALPIVLLCTCLDTHVHTHIWTDSFTCFGTGWLFDFCHWLDSSHVICRLPSCDHTCLDVCGAVATLGFLQTMAPNILSIITEQHMDQHRRETCNPREAF